MLVLPFHVLFRGVSLLDAFQTCHPLVVSFTPISFTKQAHFHQYLSIGNGREKLGYHTMGTRLSAPEPCILVELGLINATDVCRLNSLVGGSAENGVVVETDQIEPRVD